jgi:DNA-binding NarL/FixJ family response regulator
LQRPARAAHHLLCRLYEKISAQIAHKLGLVKRTVDFHVDNARIKLCAATRSEAVMKAVAAGLIEP